jgi:uncharacterized protein (DUF4213/DUF364 family)
MLTSLTVLLGGGSMAGWVGLIVPHAARLLIGLMTGVTLTNKTLPRLMELGARAQMVLVGPSVPLAPLWFGKGIAFLAGTAVLEAERLWKHVALGGDRSIFQHGAHTVKLTPGDANAMRRSGGRVLL